MLFCNVKVIACVPVYNEANGIQNLIKEIKKFVDIVVVCDDGSTDNTYDKLLLTDVKILRHTKNLGKGAALRTLFDYVKELDAGVIVTIDGDGQFLPHEIPKLVKPIIENKSDIVIGYRFDDSDEMPLYRKMGNKFLDKVTNIASDLPFRDTQSGFRSYSRNAIEKIQFKTNGFGADSEILISASKNKLRISEEKVTVLYNTGNKTSTKNPVSHTGEVITSLIELVALKKPLSYLGIPGIIFLIIGIFFSSYVVSTFNETRYFSIPFTLLSLGTFLIGLMLILMSIVLFGISRLQK